MNAFPRSLRALLTTSVLLLAAESQAVLEAFQKDKGRGKVNLMSSRVRATVGPQWVDIEEEAELQVIADAKDTSRVFQIRGTLQFPARSIVVGCLVWRDDTALKAKLRPQAQAHGQFLDIVNDTSTFSQDPVLLELDSADQYSLRAYPFLTQGSRRIRIRYLVPVLASSGEVQVHPVFSQTSGSLPSDWVLETRGKPDSLRAVQSGRAMPVSSPASLVYSFSNPGRVSLVWGRNADPSVSHAVFDRIQGGTWEGEYALFSGTIPDTIAARAARRAEIVVLWRWIHSEAFFDTCWSQNPVTGVPEARRCLSEHGNRAISQAQEIRKLADRTIARGHRFSLVMDHGLDDTCRVFSLSDSTVRNSWDIRNWLQGVDADYLGWRIPTDVAPQTPTLETSRNRTRFISDLAKVGAVYSKDSGWVRHLLVATTGPILSGGDLLQVPDLTSLPADVSVRSCLFDSLDYTWSDAAQDYVSSGFARSRWPGVDLTRAEVLRPGTDMALVENVWLPRTRDVLSGNLRIQAGTDMIVPFQSRRSSIGKWPIGINAYAAKLSKEVKAELYAEDGSSIATWSFTPGWVELTQDSVVPRLWARSSGRISNVSGFVAPTSLANTFGYVDAAYSLIAIPSDTMGQVASLKVSDSLVPFLEPREIFTRAGYKDGPGQSRIDPKVLKRNGLPQARWMGSRRLLLDFDGLAVQTVELVDVQGRVLFHVGPESLRGLGRYEMDLSSMAGRKGMVLARLATSSGWKTLPLLLP